MEPFAVTQTNTIGPPSTDLDGRTPPLRRPQETHGSRRLAILVVLAACA